MNNKPTQRRVGPAILKALMFFGIFFGAQLIVSTAFSSIFSFMSMAQLGTVDEDFVLAKTNECLLEMTVISNALAVVVSLFVSILFKRQPALEAVEITSSLDRKLPVLGTCVALGVFGQIAILFILNVIPFPESWIDMLEENNASISDGSVAMQIITVAIMAPITEEIIFRAGVCGSLKTGVHKWLAIIVSSLVFGIMHLNPIGIIYATVLGILMGWLYTRFNSLLPSLVFHFAFNSTSLLLELFGEIPLLVCIVSIVIFLGCIGFLAYLGLLPPVDQNSDNQGDN